MTRAMKDSGVEWIGEIPENWNVQKIKSLYKIQTGFTPSTNRPEYYAFDEACGYDWITIGDLDGTYYIPNSTKAKISDTYIKEFEPKITPKGSLLYSFKLSVGSVAMTDREVYTNEAIASFLPYPNVNLNFLYYSSFMIVENANENIYGAKILNQDLIKNALIIFPPLSEQQKIADFLDEKCGAIDEIISKTEQSIEEYKKLKQSVITKAVTKGIRPNRPMQDSDIEWIGEIPTDWNVRKIFQLFNQVKNKNIGMTENNLLSLSYGKIKKKNIETSFGLLPESFETYNIIEKDDIVLRLTDLQNDHRSLRVGLCKERGIITSAYVTIRLKDKQYAPYLYYLLHTFDIKKGFYGMGDGVRQGLNWDELKHLSLVLPLFDEQKEIADYLDEKCAEIDTLIEKKQQFLSEMANYRKSLIYEYVTGKKEVA